MTTANNPWQDGDPYPRINGGTIGFMMDPNRGKPRIGKISTNTTNNKVTITETNVTTLTSSHFTFGGIDIS